ncbi:MAG: alpha/beta hydrolase [Steroidobacteraceae bacterium]
MKPGTRRVVWVVVVLVAALAALVVAARRGSFEADPTAAEARYGAPPSKFIDIDGTRIHYRDEGSGPVLVLLHGSRANLQQWDGWARELGGRFRIIRFDAHGHGLTGPDGLNDYSAQRQLDLMDGLLVKLGVERCIVGGTSGGATLAVRYAAQHPDRVQALLLSTLPLRLPAAPRTAAADRAVFWFHDKVLGTYATSLYWRTFLRSIVADPSIVTPELVDRYRTLNTLPGQQQRFVARLASWRAEGGPDRDFALAGKVTAPVLLQWGDAGPVLPQELHGKIASAFTGTKVKVISYRELGHLLVLEDPQRTARDALAFLQAAGVLDALAEPGEPGEPGR